MWVRAVWFEGGDNLEMEGVIPNTWVAGEVVYWPPGSNAENAISNMLPPGKSWRQFTLKQNKFCSGEILIL